MYDLSIIDILSPIEKELIILFDNPSRARNLGKKLLYNF